MGFLKKDYVELIECNLKEDSEAYVLVTEKDNEVFVSCSNSVDGGSGGSMTFDTSFFLGYSSVIQEAIKELKSLYPERVKINKGGEVE
jgi:hypothetical protein